MRITEIQSIANCEMKPGDVVCRIAKTFNTSRLMREFRVERVLEDALDVVCLGNNVRKRIHRRQYFAWRMKEGADVQVNR